MMKRLVIVAIAFFVLACSEDQLPQKPRIISLFDEGWLFHRGDTTGAEHPNFDDADWRRISLPHDWSIEDIPGTDSPLDPDAPGEVSAGFFVGGTSWYRKHFTLDPKQQGKHIYLQFDGIYMNADIWLNGIHLGNHPYGYTTFGYDISDLVDFGNENVLAVEVKNEGRNSRWYAGSGIYRHVWLMTAEPVHIPVWGISITTSMVRSKWASVKAEISLRNSTAAGKRLNVLSRIVGPSGILRSQTQNVVEIGSDSITILEQSFELERPILWSPESPALYTMSTQVFESDELVDAVEETFGIRTISFSVEDGFLLNGDPVLLKGGCMHHGNGPLGAAAYDRAEERRVELMKASGFNAIRCAHNPPSEAFLDACDRLGIMVIDEAFDMWRRPKNPQDYHLYFDDWWQEDVKSMVLRDRNHPSIIMWSTGNEIPERAEQEGVETSIMLANFIRHIDPTRPITAAVNGLNPDKDPYFATLDIAGYNYASGGDHWKSTIYQTDHERVPDRIMYGAESYPLEAFDAWMDAVDLTYVIGDFVWTGFDYLGEASIGWLGYMQKKEFYPWSHAYCGDIDICGWKRPQSYYRDILWQVGTKPYLFVVPPEPSFELNPEKMKWSKWEWHDVVDSWNWERHEGAPLEVHVYNRSDSAELFLNERSLGIQVTNRFNEWIAKWEVPYTSGVLKVVNFIEGAPAESSQLMTAAQPTKIAMKPDRASIKADGQDLCYVTVELLDENEIRNPTSSNLVEFSIEGPGEIIAVASSNPMSTESYQQSARKAFRGRCLAIVKAGKEQGEVVLTASSEGFSENSIKIQVE